MALGFVGLGWLYCDDADGPKRQNIYWSLEKKPPIHSMSFVYSNCILLFSQNFGTLQLVGLDVEEPCLMKQKSLV